MASVAAAIEEAALPQADANLWWDSHTLLFQALDKCIACDVGLSLEEYARSPSVHESQDFDKEAALAEKFLVNDRWLLKTLTEFNPPSARSRAALNSSRIAVGSHILEITSSLKDLALEVSALVVLDEIQSYILTSRVSELEPVLSSLTDNVLLSAVRNLRRLRVAIPA